MSTSVNLDVIAAGLGGEIILHGTTHRVLAISGAGLHRLLAGAASDQALERIQAMYDVAALSVPTLTREQIDALAVPQVEQILEIARRTEQAVEASAPNAGGPAAAVPSSSPA